MVNKNPLITGGLGKDTAKVKAQKKVLAYAIC